MNSEYQPTESKFGRVWLITWLAIAALLVGKSIWWTGDESQQVASAASTVDVSLNQPGLGLPQTRTVHEFKAIEDLRVGDRVVSDNPDTPSSLKLGPEQTAVDPATWRKVTLYAEETWPDGTLDTILIETLQPPLWFELYEAKVGSQVPPPLDLLEMGLPEHLMTTVEAIEPCPPIARDTGKAGTGRVVLTTVNHLNNDVWQLTAVNESGRREQLKPTGFHKFYSETRQDWVSTKDIHDREVIRGRAGPLTIVDAKKLPGTERVYNLTVEGEHVYYVSQLGLLAHNTCPNDSGLLPTEFSRNARQYLRVVEQNTGVRLHKTQRRRLIEDLRTNKYTRLSPTAGRSHRRSFTQRVRTAQISEWERHTGKVWPRYAEDLVNNDGVILRRAGDAYDAHHVIENIYGGPHQWWNLTPARFPDQHQGGIHLDEIMDVLFP